MSMRRLVLAIPIAVFSAMLFSSERTGASGGDFSLDFIAAAPFSYSHDTGGGAYNTRTIGKFNDVVESLEGGDYACRDIVTFFTQIRVDAGAVGSQTIRLNYQWTAYSTGQQGVALVNNKDRVPPAGVSAGVNAPDQGTIESGVPNAVATVVPGSESYSGLVFTKPTTFFRSVDVSGLEAGEKVVVRTDVAIACNGDKPTGNMQGRLASASVIAPLGAVSAINTGDQTVPFKHVGDIKPPACDPKTDPTCK